MDKATLRPIVFEILKRSPQTHFHAIENDVRRQLEAYERHDVLILQEVFWELLMQGILAPGKNSLNLNLPFVHVTEYGAQCLEDGRILAHDPDAYMQRLQATVARPIPDVVRQPVHEALEVFLAGKEVSAVILLARAAEHLFDHLSEAVLKSEACEGRAKPEIESAPRASRRRAEAVVHAVRDCRVPEPIRESIEPQMNGLLALVQHSRTLDGSPRWPNPSRDQVLGFFLLFPEQCRFVYHLIELLSRSM